MVSNNIATATVEINVNGDGGSNSESSGGSKNKSLSELKKITKLMGINTKSVEGLTSVTRMASKLGQAGLFAASLGAIAMGTGAGLSAMQQANNEGRGYSYDKINVAGQEKVAKIDESTGQISDIVSKQEAEQMRILDYNGNIKAELQTHNQKYEASTSRLTRIDGILQINELILSQISTAQYKEYKAQVEIANIKEAQLVIERERLKTMQMAVSKAGENASYAPGTKPQTWEQLAESITGKSQQSGPVASVLPPTPSQSTGQKEYTSANDWFSHGGLNDLANMILNASRQKNVDKTPAVEIQVK